MTIEEQLIRIYNNVPKVYEAGIAEGERRQPDKQFCTTVKGNGDSSLSFNIPFEPDAISVFASEFNMYGKLGSDPFVSTFQADLAGFGMVGGRGMFFKGSSESGATFTTTSVRSRYTIDPNGEVTINFSDFTLAGNKNSVANFIQDADYVVLAAKYVFVSDKDRITDAVRKLPDSGGGVTLNREKVNAAFTTEEWAELIEQKPNWTFSFV